MRIREGVSYIRWLFLHQLLLLPLSFFIYQDRCLNDLGAGLVNVEEMMKEILREGMG